MENKKLDILAQIPEYREVLKDLLIQEKQHEIAARNLMLRATLLVFVIGNFACISLFFLNGFGLTNLSDVAMGSLAAATIAEVAGLLVIAVKYFFQKDNK